jgi:hypothetical protein
MTIVDFFDPCNYEHIQAFDYLSKKGTWPTEFYSYIIENHIEFPVAWQVSLAYKIVNEYVQVLLDRRIIKVKYV